jgi:6-phosphogluconolactonase
VRIALLLLCGCTAMPLAVPDSGMPDAGAADGGVQDAGTPDAGVTDAGVPDAGVPDAGVPLTTYVYVGTGGTNIYLFELSDGGLLPRGTFAAGTAPSFLALTPGTLYAVNEGTSQVAAFSIGDGGSLALLNRVPSGGSGPAHVTVADGFVYVANYGSGHAARFPILAGGALGAADHTQLVGTHAHEVVVSGNNVYVPCLGSDFVAQLTPALAPQSTAPVAAGSGPRHLALHPNGRWAYVINETKSTVTLFDVDAGTLSARATVSTLPAGFTGSNTGAEIWMHPSGQWVYGSNRGRDSIVQFHVEADGTLTQLAQTDTGGQDPRHFGVTPDARLLIAANQTTDNLVAMQLDPSTGALTVLGEVAQVPNPEFVGFIQR